MSLIESNVSGPKTIGKKFAQSITQENKEA